MTGERRATDREQHRRGAGTDLRARAAAELDRARVRSLGLTDAADDEPASTSTPR